MPHNEDGLALPQSRRRHLVPELLRPRPLVLERLRLQDEMDHVDVLLGG